MDKYLYSQNQSKGNYNFVMAYPAQKAFALSSLGYMWLFKTADSIEGINAEMCFTDSTPNTRPDEINALSFSMSFDFDFLNVFKIMENFKIPLLSKDRPERLPLIFAGGPAITTNPEPYKNIFDFMIIGDGESILPKILNILSSNPVKRNALAELSKLEGILVPQHTKKVKKLTEPLSNVIYTPILSNESYFKNTFIIELSRGCMNRCAFCTASYTNLPYRSCEYKKIIDALELGLKHTNKIALLGAQISAHPQFNEIINYIKNKMENGTNIELGVSSLRTDAISPELIQTLVKGGQKTSTIAIEAASESLRKFINKNLSEEQIIDAVKISANNGLKGLKIYSMIGIPNETDDDIHEFITLAEKLKKINKSFNLSFSFSTFVPKPQTPLQRAKREDTKSLETKQKYIEKNMAKLGMETKFSSIKWDYWQTIISRGDESLTPLLIEAYKNGGKIGAFKSALKNTGVNISKTINGFSFDEPLPWNYIEFNQPQSFLISEYKRLKRISNYNY